MEVRNLKYPLWNSLPPYFQKTNKQLIFCFTLSSPCFHCPQSVLQLVDVFYWWGDPKLHYRRVKFHSGSAFMGLLWFLNLFAIWHGSKGSIENPLVSKYNFSCHYFVTESIFSLINWDWLLPLLMALWPKRKKWPGGSLHSRVMETSCPLVKISVTWKLLPLNKQNQKFKR